MPFVALKMSVTNSLAAQAEHANIPKRTARKAVFLAVLLINVIQWGYVGGLVLYSLVVCILLFVPARTLYASPKVSGVVILLIG